MKRLSTILAGVLLALGVSYVQAEETTPLQTGARLNTYKVTKTDGTYRNLTDNATVLLTSTKDSLINHLYFKKDGGADPVAVGEKGRVWIAYTPAPAEKVATIELPDPMMFGAVKAKNIGVTSDGFLFFAAENEKVVPSFFAGDNGVTNNLLSKAKGSAYSDVGGQTKNLLYFLVADLENDKYKNATSLYANTDTKIGYETVDNVLYIGYENIIIKESAIENQVVSWNYQINLQTGSIALQTKGFYADATKDYPSRRFAFGLLGATQADDQYWLTGFDPVSATGAGSTMQQFVFGKGTSPKEGTLYTFSQPEACAAVTGATVDVKKTVNANSINLSGTTWTGSDNALIILSETESLKTQPEDGKEYAVGTGSVKVGDNKAAYLVAKNEKGAVTGLNAFSGLKAATDYWVHVFVYNRACSDGPLYGTAAKVEKITTALPAPTVRENALSDILTASLKLTLPEPISGTKYVVGVSEKPLQDQWGQSIPNVLENGKTYQAGDKVHNGNCTLMQVGVDAGTYTVDQLKSGSIVYINVWYVKGTGSQVEYSATATRLEALTIYEVPAVVDFANVTGQYPMGWNLQESDNGNWSLAQYGSSGEGPLSGRVPAQGGFYLLGTIMPDYDFDEDFEMTIKPGTYSIYAVSPVITKGNKDKLALEFRIGMGSVDFQAGYLPTAMKEGDSVVISYARNHDSETWKPVARAGKELKMQEGFGSLTVSDFSPEIDTFCFKFEYYQTSTTELVMTGCVIEGFIVEEDIPCKYPQNIAVAQEEITTTSAIVRWEDGNADFAEKFIVKYRPAEGENAEISLEVNTDTVVLTNLRHTTPYTVSVQAVCKGDKGNSLVKTATFATQYALGLPYLYEANKENGLPQASKNMRGEPGGELKEISAQTDYPAIGWEWTQDAAQGKDMTAAVNLDVNTNTWLILPSMTAEHTGTVSLGINATAYSLDGTYVAGEATKTSDTLWVFVSSSNDFKTRNVVAAMPVDSFHFKMEPLGQWSDTMHYTLVDGMEFEVEQGKEYHVAFFVSGKGALSPDDWEYTNNTVLAIGSIAMDYSRIVYPAVTDIQTSDLSQTGFRLSWNGEADTYRVLWKEAAATTAYDTTAASAQKSFTFSGLKPATEYAYRVYGIYNGEAGLVSAEAKITTLPFATLDTVKNPVFNPASGSTVAPKTIVRITCPTDSVTIYYTVDGSMPNLTSSRYQFGITVDTSVTIKAIAMRTGWISSEVVEATYTVQATANETSELAGVSLYPNPTSGSFRVVVPVSVNVEIFASSGIIVKRFAMAAGNEEVRLDKSGIYFVRVTAEDGKAAVKRVVVR